MTNFKYKEYYFFERAYFKLRKYFNTLYHRFLLNNKQLEIGYNSRFYLNKIQIGNNVKIGNNVHFSSELNLGYLEIHDNVQIDDNVLIDCSGGVIIQDNVHISADVTIYTHSHGYNPKNQPIASMLIIENDVWIGAKSSILQNVEVIKKNILIGYSSKITKNLDKVDSIYIDNNMIKLRYT
jgi:acetyltransferase-like isoleucine patch superfamily enzyme